MNADPDCSGCISVRSCRSAAAANTLAFPRMRSIWYRECGQDLWTMCKGVIRTPTLMSRPEWRLQKCEPGRRRRPDFLGFCKSAHGEQWPHSLQAFRFEHFYGVPAVPAHFASDHVDHIANLKTAATPFSSQSVTPPIAKWVDNRDWSTVSPRGARDKIFWRLQDAGRVCRFVKDSAARHRSSTTVVFSRRSARSLGVPPVCGLGLALGLRPCETSEGRAGPANLSTGLSGIGKRSCNMASVRQREGTLTPPTQLCGRRTERIGSRACIECLGLGVFRSTYPKHLFRRWSSQQLVSLVVVTWGSMLPKALPPFQVLGLALFSLRGKLSENKDEVGRS